MNFRNLVCCLIGVLIFPQIYSQEVDDKKKSNTNTNKFRQLYQEFSSPNIYRAASGAPGPSYYQQQADYKINVELDDGIGKKKNETGKKKHVGKLQKELTTLTAYCQGRYCRQDIAKVH